MFPSSSGHKGRSGSAQQAFGVQVCTLFLCPGGAGVLRGGNLAACPLWKGSSCLRRNSSHTFAVKKVLTCFLGAFSEQVKTGQRQLLSAGRKRPVFSSPGLGCRSGALGKAVPGGSYFVPSKQAQQDALMFAAFIHCWGDALATAEKLMVPRCAVGECWRVSWHPPSRLLGQTMMLGTCLWCSSKP